MWDGKVENALPSLMVDVQLPIEELAGCESTMDSRHTSSHSSSSAHHRPAGRNPLYLLPLRTFGTVHWVLVGPICIGWLVNKHSYGMM